MAEIILDLSGQSGLADNFFGDRDMITPQPHLRIGEPGEMAQGIYNPHLRMGYMAPASTTTTTLTLDTAQTNNLTSVVFDENNDTLYFAERGTKIYALDGLTDTSLENVIELSSGEQIQDLEIYEVNTKRNLFYLYSKDESIQEVRLSRRGMWSTRTVAINPFSSIKPKIIARGEATISATSKSITVDVPTGSNISCLVFIGGVPASSVEIDSVAMSSVDQVSFPYQIGTHDATLYSLANVGSGTKIVTATFGSSGYRTINVLFIENTSLTPIGAIETLYGQTSVPVFSHTQEDNKLNLGFLYSTRAAPEVSNAASYSEYNASTQTSGNGYGVALSSNGTKMYVSGGSAPAATIYQYTLSSPWVITSGVTYDSISLNHSAQINGTVSGIVFSPDGTRMFLRSSSFAAVDAVVKTWNLSTAWNISTATYDSTKDSTNLVGVATSSFGFCFSYDGLHYFASGTEDGLHPAIFHYTLGTAWDPSTAVFSNSLRLREIMSFSNALPGPVSIDPSGTVLIIQHGASGDSYFTLNFNPRFPYDVSKCTLAVSSSGLIDTRANATYQPIGGIHIGLNESSYFRRNVGGASGGNIVRVIHNAGTAPDKGEEVYELKEGKTLECGTAPLPLGSLKDNTWLTETAGVNITTQAAYNFLRKADNGFAYLFAGSAVHKIDGGLTGGKDGSVTKNVLLLPDYFTITDAVDFRSRIYIAVHQYPVDSSVNSQRVHAGRAGILVWDRISSQLGGTDFIEIPGVREIKKIYSSPDGMIKMIVISDTGLVELRQFGYNDSGGVVFRIMKTLGQGAEPQYPDGLTVGGTQAMWLGNDGYIYSEKENAVTKLFEVKAPGVTTPTLKNNINSGALFYGGDTGSATDGYRYNRETLTFGYSVTGLMTTDYFVKRVYPFSILTNTNGSQTPHVGDVYSTVQYVPITSIVRKVRVYNAPITGTGTGVIATVKLYFNQSSTVGMTKSISKDEAKRGYVDFAINKPYVHAIQIEVEWATGEPLGADMYLPSVAIISHDPTSTSSPDNE